MSFKTATMSQLERLFELSDQAILRKDWKRFLLARATVDCVAMEADDPRVKRLAKQVSAILNKKDLRELQKPA